jgi:WD40 repeat protein
MFHPQEENHIISCSKESVVFEWQSNSHDRRAVNCQTLISTEEQATSLININCVDYHENGKLLLFGSESESIFIINESVEFAQ